MYESGAQKRRKVIGAAQKHAASAERTFSMLRRLKTWLRSTMCDERLTGLALLTSSDIEIKLEDVIERFLNNGKRRIAP